MVRLKSGNGFTRLLYLDVIPAQIQFSMSSCLLLRLLRRFGYLDSVFHKLVISQINFINNLINMLNNIYNKYLQNLSKSDMKPNSEVTTLYRIVNHFQSLQYIQPQIIKNTLQSKKQDLSCYIGLMNLLYNLTIQFKQKESLKLKTDFKIVQQPYQNMYNQLDIGNILHIRGQILKQYGKFFNQLFYKPAYQLARFNYQQFNRFCNYHGFSQLVRHTRGIYPVIDPKLQKPLQFLSLYKQSLPSGGFLIGNQNWQIARKTIKTYYQQEIKHNEMEDEESNSLFNISGYLQQNNNVNQANNYDQYMRRGVKFSYILLTQQYQQLQNAINQFQQMFVKNQGSDKKYKQMLDRLRFWLENSKRFVCQGLQMYLSSKVIAELPPVVYNFQLNYFEDIVIYLIEKIFYLITTKDSKKLLQQTKADLQQKMNNLNEMVRDDSVILKNSDKMFLLSYIHVIYKILFPNQLENDNSKKIYDEIKTNNSPLQQPYNRVFFQDKQLLSLYEKGLITEFPTCFQYSSQITKQILRLLIKKNPQNILRYFQKINILNHYQRLNIVLDSKLIGDISKISGNQNVEQTQGQRLLNQLQKMVKQPQYKRVLKNQAGGQFGIADDVKINAIFKDFIQSWRKYYSFIRNFNEESLKEFLLKFKQSQTQRFRNEQKKKQARNYLIPSDFIAPHRRKDCYYHFIEKFIKGLQNQVETYSIMLQQQQQQSKLGSMAQRLTKYFKIMMTSQFKLMLSQANIDQSRKQNEALMQQQNKVTGKQNFEDHVWEVYASAYLLLNQFSKKLIQNEQKIQQKKSITIKKPNAPTQSMNYFGQYPKYHEIDIESDD